MKYQQKDIEYFYNNIGASSLKLDKDEKDQSFFLLKQQRSLPKVKVLIMLRKFGFEIVDKLQKEFGLADFEFNKKFNAEISSGDYHLPTTNQKLILAKAQTFMNLSGETVRAVLDFYKLTADDIIVIQDDLDIEIGTYKIATDSRAAGHNGVQNIIDQLGTQKFARVRIGVGEEREGAPVCRLGAHDFVLGKFTSDEFEKITQLLPEIISEIKKLLQ